MVIILRSAGARLRSGHLPEPTSTGSGRLTECRQQPVLGSTTSTLSPFTTASAETVWMVLVLGSRIPRLQATTSVRRVQSVAWVGFEISWNAVMTWTLESVASSLVTITIGLSAGS